MKKKKKEWGKTYSRLVCVFNMKKKTPRKTGKKDRYIWLLEIKRDKSLLWVFQMHFITSHVVNGNDSS